MRLENLWLGLVSGLAALSLAAPISQDAISREGLPRLVIYFQTTHDSKNQPISMLPLVKKQGIALTHLVVCSFHINADSEVHLNDYPPQDAHFYTLWNETAVLQSAGVKVMGMVGGAAPGSFDVATLDSRDTDTFEHYYSQLADVVRTYGLQGMDLDVEQVMSDDGIARLVSRLHGDFGSGFEISLAPVASALTNSSNLSGFDYKKLETTLGSDISFYNAQFYNGFGFMGSPDDYEAAVAGGFAASKVLAGQITNPEAGSEFIPFDQLNATIRTLQAKYGQIGGIMGWEYFNSDPGGTATPWEWAQEMTSILRPDAQVHMPITKELAESLIAAWEASVAVSGARVGSLPAPTVDYMAMVDA